MSMKMYCIYRITNKLNGKTYIGQHKYKDLSEDKYMGSGKLIKEAINKYGIENFEKEIIVSEIETQNKIDELEKEYIRLERESGHGEYNISNGGESWNLSGKNHPWYGKHISEEMKSKLSKSMIGNTHFLGKHHSVETKKKLSESHKRENLSEETRRKMSEASRKENLSEDTIKKRSEALKGKHHSIESIRKMSESKRGKHFSIETRLNKSKLMKGKRYYNNGIECHMYEPGTEPEGYTLGHLHK